MKFIKSSLFSFILFGLLAFNFFSGCTRGDKLKELHPVESPTILADGVCPESVELTTTYTIMDPVLYPDLCAGWDLVVAVSVTDSPDLPDGCECASNEYCIYLRVPQYTEPGFEVAYSKVNATQSPLLLTIGNPNYYQGYEPNPISANPHISPNFIVEGVPAYTLHQICSADDSYYIFYNYPDYVSPSDYHASPVADVSGICIVTNIGNDTGGGGGGQ